MDDTQARKGVTHDSLRRGQKGLIVAATASFSSTKLLYRASFDLLVLPTRLLCPLESSDACLLLGRRFVTNRFGSGLYNKRTELQKYSARISAAWNGVAHLGKTVIDVLGLGAMHRGREDDGVRVWSIISLTFGSADS